MSAHRWQAVRPENGELFRHVCVVCDVLRMSREGLADVYSHSGKVWALRAPECVAPASAKASTEARDAR